MDYARLIQTCAAPSRPLPALQLLVKNLHVNGDLTLALQMRAASKSALGIGAQQAPVAQPPMLARLEAAMRAVLSTMTRICAHCLDCGSCPSLGPLRWTHLLLRATDKTLFFECLRGKQKGRRAGFHWSVPREGVQFDQRRFPGRGHGVAC